MRVIGTEGMDVQYWTAATGFNLEKFGATPILTDPQKWQDWGAAVLLLASLSGVVLPNPYEFENWQVWAQRFNEVLAGRKA